MGAIRPRPARSTRKHARAFRLAILAVTLCVFLLAGCGKKRHLFDPIPPRYLVLSSPANVLLALAKAYTSRDSAEYKLLFHDSYQGTSLDQRDPSPYPLTFTKADEAQHIAALARDPSLMGVDLQLVASLVRFTDAGDPTGWATIQNPIARLSILGFPDSYTITPAEETIEFRFIPKTPDSASPTDTTWKIIRWTEIAN